jgi:mRNA interferase MazF
MVVERGEIWWSELPEPVGSGPGYDRAVLVIQSEFFNESSINTVIVAIITTNLELSDMPGNVTLTKRVSGLPKESVVNITQLFTIDRRLLKEYVGTLPARKMSQVNAGLKFALSLESHE